MEWSSNEQFSSFPSRTYILTSRPGPTGSQRWLPERTKLLRKPRSKGWQILSKSANDSAYIQVWKGNKNQTKVIFAMFKLTWKEPHSWWEAQWQWKQGLWRGQIISRWRWGYLSGICFSGRSRGCGTSRQFLKLHTASQKRNLRDEKEWKLGHYHVFWCWINKSYDSQYKRILHVFQLNCKLISFYKLFLRSWCMVCPAMTPDRAPPTSLWSLGIMVNNVWSDKHWLRSPHYWVTLTQQTRDIIISAASEHTEPWLASLVRCWPLIGQSGQMLASHWSVFRVRVSSDRQR